MKNTLLLKVRLLASSMAVSIAVSAAPVEIGSRLELLADDALVESLKGGAAFELHHPVLAPKEPGAQPQQPWGNVFKSNGRYQMIVRGLKDPKVGWKQSGAEAHYLNHILLYYESKDGIRWQAPKLGLHDLPAFPQGNDLIRRTSCSGRSTSSFASDTSARLKTSSPRGCAR